MIFALYYDHLFTALALLKFCENERSVLGYLLLYKAYIWYAQSIHAKSWSIIL